MAKKRGETHLVEDKSQILLTSLLPNEWVIRKLHPDYGVDLTIEVFERTKRDIPTMGEFLFVQLKATESAVRKNFKVLKRKNIEKFLDSGVGEVAFKIEVIAFQIDVDTLDNARLMGPSTPLLLFLADLSANEVYFICLTDYYDKILEPQSFAFDQQRTITIKVPTSNKLSDPRSVQVLRFYAARAKLYGMFNLAQFQYRESRYLIDDLIHSTEDDRKNSLKIIERFAQRLRSMPVWERDLPWALLDFYRHRIDAILLRLQQSGNVPKLMKPMDKETETQLIFLAQDLRHAWEQFSAIGQTFEDPVREWFLPTFVGQIGNVTADSLSAA